MSFDVRTVIKLVNAGFNVEEIEDILAPKDTNGSDPTPTPAAADPSPAPTPAAADPSPAPTPAAADPTPTASDPTPINIDDLKKTINDGFQSIIEAFQVSEVGRSNQPMPAAKTSEDILAEIISPFDK